MIFIGLFLMFIIVSVTSFMRSLFIAGMRLLGGGGIGFEISPWCIPIRGFVQIWFPQLPFFSVGPILRLVVLGCLRIQQGLKRNSFSTFAGGRQPCGFR